MTTAPQSPELGGVLVGVAYRVETLLDHAFETVGLATPTGLDRFAAIVGEGDYTTSALRMDLDRDGLEGVLGHVGDAGEPVFELQVRDTENPKHKAGSYLDYLDPATIETPTTIEELHDRQARRFYTYSEPIVAVLDAFEKARKAGA